MVARRTRRVLSLAREVSRMSHRTWVKSLRLRLRPVEETLVGRMVGGRHFVMLILLREVGWKLRGLYNNWVVGVGREAQGTVGGEGGTAHGLEGDDIDAVG